MYEIDIFENIKMDLDWYMIYWGIEHDMLSPNTARDYVCKKIECEESVYDEEIEIAWKTDDILDILDNIKKIPDFTDHIMEKMVQAKEKICAAIMISLRQKEHDISKLFERLEIVYADFDYPEYMDKFIPYMPAGDDYMPQDYSLEANRQRCLDQLDFYIDKQIKKYQLHIQEND